MVLWRALALFLNISELPARLSVERENKIMKFFFFFFFFKTPKIIIIHVIDLKTEQSEVMHVKTADGIIMTM